MSSARSTSLLWEVSLPPNVIEDQETHVCFPEMIGFGFLIIAAIIMALMVWISWELIQGVKTVSQEL